MKILKSTLRIGLFSAIILGSMTVNATPAEVWVSPNGTDSKDAGSKDKPYASVSKAVRKAREMRRLKDSTISEGINIILKGGVYELDETLFIRPEDSGTENSPTTIMAAQGEKPVLSGGIKVKGWRKGNVAGLPKAAQGKVWIADAPKVGGRSIDIRQMWINGKKGVRARDLNDGKMSRILSLDKAKQEIWIPAPKTGKWKDPAPMEFVIHQMWEIAILRVKSIDVVGDKAKLTFYQPESRIQFEHPWPPAVIQPDSMGGNSAFYLTNAIEFLDQPGEWFNDPKSGKIIYYPRQGEDMSKAEVAIPYLENIARVEGTLDAPVSYVHFKNIGFQYASWNRPSVAGHVPLQAGMYILEAYTLNPKPGTNEKWYLCNQAWTGRMPAGVILKNVNHTSFNRCNFEHMAACGLDYLEGSRYDSIQGCIFRDLGGSGLQAGVFNDEAFEAHRFYNPADERVLSRNMYIANNLVEDVTNEEWGTCGMSIGMVRDFTIEYNEIRDVSYSGIAVGWGWTRDITCMRNNLIRKNHIHHFAKHMYDVGGIYTLSAQPGTIIEENYIHDLLPAPYAHDKEHYQYIYLDEGSWYMIVRNNYCEKAKFKENNKISRNVWENNGPQVSQDVIKNAGIQSEFKDILDNK